VPRRLVMSPYPLLLGAEITLTSGYFQAESDTTSGSAADKRTVVTPLMTLQPLTSSCGNSIYLDVH